QKLRMRLWSTEAVGRRAAGSSEANAEASAVRAAPSWKRRERRLRSPPASPAAVEGENDEAGDHQHAGEAEAPRLDVPPEERAQDVDEREPDPAREEREAGTTEQHRRFHRSGGRRPAASTSPHPAA